jgi:hypothetical protein
MAKIGILTCSNATQELGCSSVSCLADFRRRKGTFADYPPEEKLTLTGIITCPGSCDVREPSVKHRLRRVAAGLFAAVQIICAAGSPAYGATGAPGAAGRNRLAREKSPYLLQHAGNPVDWYPWGQEAFAKARREGKPIFLSIGYSTCHWCHVMEEESFEDAAVARFLNERFVAIKVDREERPDIDALYMNAAVEMTGGGGWPLTIVMTPDGKPFFAGNYFPKESRFGRPGLLEILGRVATLWREHREQALAAAASNAAALVRPPATHTAQTPGAEVFPAAFAALRARYDERYGGFGTGQKFPMPHQLMFLLRYAERSGNREAGEMARATLEALRRGGVYDQLGSGFHRYATDRQFLVPHFEKMLADQALLAIAFLEGFQATGERLFADTARDLLAYVLREMTSPEGAFYTAEDADSEGEEGRFYTWTEREILDVLGPADGREFALDYGVRPGGNYRDPATGEASPRNILHRARQVPDAAADARRRGLLLAVRAKRPRPFRDDKVLASWNGLMIGALARGGLVLEEPRFTAAAARAADFVLARLRDRDGRLLHRFREGESAVPAHLDDYACLTFGLVELYEAGFEPRNLREAMALNEAMLRLFRDPEGGGLLFSGEGNERLLAPLRETFDGALPSSSAIVLWNLARLGLLSGDAKLLDRAQELLRSFGAEVREQLQGRLATLIALDVLLGPARSVVVAGRPGAADTSALLRALAGRFLPGTVVLLHPPGDAGAEIEALAGFLRYQTMRDGKATAYVCVDSVCREPTTDPAAMLRLLSPPQ